jgi:hypothetical protein
MKAIVSINKAGLTLFPSSSDFFDNLFYYCELPSWKRCEMKEWFEQVCQVYDKDKDSAFQLLGEMKDADYKECSSFLSGEIHLMDTILIRY